MPAVTDHGPSTYGDAIAEVYDDWMSELDPTEAVAFLASLVPSGGRALELGIGTGRIALPLAAAGVQVQGIDASERMVDRLRAKPGGKHLPIVLGDFADVGVEDLFELVFVAFSTFFALPSQQEQLRCLCNVAAHLVPGGCFVVETFVPDLGRFRNHQAVTFRDVTAEGVRLDVARHDPVEQRIEATHVLLGPSGTRTFPAYLRYAWPAELDALALVAGLELEARCGGYDRSAFTAGSGTQVSIYRRSAPGS